MFSVVMLPPTIGHLAARGIDLPDQPAADAGRRGLRASSEYLRGEIDNFLVAVGTHLLQRVADRLTVRVGLLFKPGQVRTPGPRPVPRSGGRAVPSAPHTRP